MIPWLYQTIPYLFYVPQLYVSLLWILNRVGLQETKLVSIIPRTLSGFSILRKTSYFCAFPLILCTPNVNFRLDTSIALFLFCKFILELGQLLVTIQKSQLSWPRAWCTFLSAQSKLHLGFIIGTEKMMYQLKTQLSQPHILALQLAKHAQVVVIF